MPLADPRQCPECDGSGRWLVGDGRKTIDLGRCQRCRGSGLVCNLCDKSEHDCECGGAAESFDGIKPEERR